MNHEILKDLPEDNKFDFFCGSFFALNEIRKKILISRSIEEINEIIKNDLMEIRSKLNKLMIERYKAF